MIRSRGLPAAVTVGLSIVAVSGNCTAASCSVAASGVNFGTYNPLSGTPKDAAGTVTFSCNVLAGLLMSWTVSLSTGNSGSYAPRLLSNGVSTLSYNLYTSAAHSSVWGDGTGVTGLVSDHVLLIVGLNTFNYPVYGRIPAGQDAAAGGYTDTIMVTVNY
jgi:spore coat protein U domain-containing protein, fimbrial subunit CupE1/2/3/6